MCLSTDLLDGVHSWSAKVFVGKTRIPPFSHPPLILAGGASLCLLSYIASYLLLCEDMFAPNLIVHSFL